MTDLILRGLGWMYMCGRSLTKSINQWSLVQMAEDEVKILENRIGEGQWTTVDFHPTPYTP